MPFVDFIISDDCSILQAMEKINSNCGQIVFVCDDDGKVLGSLTDGDVRRCLLSGAKKEAAALEAVNKNFKWARNYGDAKKMLQQIDFIPILDERRKLIQIVSRDGIVCKDSVALPVVIQAGGLGTRLYPYTKILPKPLIPIGEKPILELIIDKFSQIGCNDFYVIVNHKRNMIKAYFNETPHDYNLEFIDEDEPLGTGGGLSLLKGKINGDFLLTNCDVLLDMDYSDLLDAHKKKNNRITMVCARKEVVIPYGVVTADNDGIVSEMREKPCFEFLTNTGLYIASREVINQMPEKTSLGFPAVFERYRSAGENVSVFVVEEAQWLDMGQLDELERMRKQLE